MWAEACAALAEAERRQREAFQPRRAARAALPVWEPPADVLETEREVLILVALPGVDPARVETVIENGVLHVAGVRLLPAELAGAAIHRLELPQGRFERRLPLPAGRYAAPVRRSLVDGCLLVRLEKLG
jgi:HSP20 family molecular chaperone IbpA